MFLVIQSAPKSFNNVAEKLHNYLKPKTSDGL